MGGHWEEKCQGFQTESMTNISFQNFQTKISKDQFCLDLSNERTSSLQVTKSMDKAKLMEAKSRGKFYCDIFCQSFFKDRKR